MRISQFRPLPFLHKLVTPGPPPASPVCEVKNQDTRPAARQVRQRVRSTTFYRRSRSSQRRHNLLPTLTELLASVETEPQPSTDAHGVLSVGRSHDQHRACAPDSPRSPSHKLVTPGPPPASPVCEEKNQDTRPTARQAAIVVSTPQHHNRHEPPSNRATAGSESCECGRMLRAAPNTPPRPGKSLQCKPEALPDRQPILRFRKVMAWRVVGLHNAR